MDDDKIAEMRQDVSLLQTEVAIVVKSHEWLKDIVTKDSARMDKLVNIVGGMDKNIAILLERVGVNTKDTKQNEVWIRENWTKIIELGAIVTFITKSVGLW